MKTIKAFTCFFAFLILAACMVYGQGVGASGDIKGVVADSSGAVIANATVTVTEAEKGLQRTATTDKGGEYRVTGLEPASYDVSSTASGFATAIQKGVVINVGQVVTLDFRLKVSAAAEKIGLPFDRVVVNIERYGNTLAGSIPIALVEALANGRAESGDLVALVGFGAGLAWGGLLLQL